MFAFVVVFVCVRELMVVSNLSTTILQDISDR